MKFLDLFNIAFPERTFTVTKSAVSRMIKRLEETHSVRTKARPETPKMD